MSMRAIFFAAAFAVTASATPFFHATPLMDVSQGGFGLIGDSGLLVGGRYLGRACSPIGCIPTNLQLFFSDGISTIVDVDSTIGAVSDINRFNTLLGSNGLLLNGVAIPTTEVSLKGLNDWNVAVGEVGYNSHGGGCGVISNLPLYCLGEPYNVGFKDINNRGDFIGYVEKLVWEDASLIREYAALISIGGQTSLLDSFDADGNRFTETHLVAINDLGQVIGNGYRVLPEWPGPVQRRPFLYQNGQLTPMNLPANDLEATVVDINNYGWVVGVGKPVLGDGNDDGDAFVAFDGINGIVLGSLTDCGGCRFVRVSDVNNLGQILATAMVGQTRKQYLLSPIAPTPEPGSMWLIASATTVLLVKIKRTKHSAKPTGS